jgi:hypothetical protein
MERAEATAVLACGGKTTFAIDDLTTW